MIKATKRIINLDAAAGEANPSSIHARGVAAAGELTEARKEVATVLGAHADEIIFTGSGTEANNLAILGVAKVASGTGRKHVITLTTEHSSVLEPCRALASMSRRSGLEPWGFEVTYLGVKPDGLIDLGEFKKALRPETIIVAVSYVNNEIGVIQPIREIAKIIRQARSQNLAPSTLFHLDACQAASFLDLNVARLGVDLMTLNSAKVGGPKGVACLYVKREIKLEPIIYGGGQERGLWSGTENVSATADFAQALAGASKKREKESARLTKLRDYFIKKLLMCNTECRTGCVTLNGSATDRVPNNVNVSFKDTDSEYIVLSLDAKGVLASSGSACSTKTKDASYVIQALGGGEARASSAVRFTLNHQTQKSDLDYVLKILPDILARARYS